MTETEARAPRISVVLPVYNGEAFIEEAVDSILKQSCSDFEFIVVNDGSTDGTREILQAMSDARLRLVDLPENRGAAEAVNQGYRLARGEFIAHMDADDIAEPDRLAKQVAFLDAHPTVTVVGTAMNFFGLHTLLSVPPLTDSKIKSVLLSGICNILNPTVMFRRRLVSEMGVWCDPSRKGVFDWDFWISALLAGAEFANMPEPLLRYRTHVKQQSRGRNDMYEIAGQVRERLLRVYFPALDEAELTAISPLLQRLSGPPIKLKQVHAGFAAIDKALMDQKPSKFGEDREELNRFLRASRSMWEKALATQIHPATDTKKPAG